jgi:hypothetical protein
MANWKYVAVAFAATAIAGSAHAASLAYDATLAAPGYYNGTGNSSDHFTTNTQGGVELGLGVQYRYTGPQVTPVAGTSTYDVNTGASTTNCGGGNCSLWNYEYSINLGSSGLTLGDITPSLTVLNEANNNVFTVPITFFPDNAGYSGTPGNYSYDSSAASTDLGEQNSENLGFFYVPLFDNTFAFDPLANDTYLFTLSGTVTSTGASIGTVQATVIAGVGATPLPAALPLFASGAVMIGFFTRRRNRNKAAV